MPRFPRREAEIGALVQSLITGLAANVVDFPAPPVSVADLTTLALAAQTAVADADVARAASEEATAVKNAAIDDLVEAMRTDLRYAEDAVDYDDAKLTALGWGGKATRSPLDPPGQARALEAPQQGEGWVFLDWKAPADGGNVSSYRVEGRERPAGDWAIVGMAVDSEITLAGQERGKDLEYRVITVNKAGEGTPSNSVAVVL